jgi:hypothetical protein
LGGWFKVFWFSIHSFYLFFSFLLILVCGGHCPLVFISKTNKQINMHWIFCMAILVVDPFGELHFHIGVRLFHEEISIIFFSFFFHFNCITIIFFSTHVGCDPLVVDLLVVVFGAYHCCLFICSS